MVSFCEISGSLFVKPREAQACTLSYSLVHSGSILQRVIKYSKVKHIICEYDLSRLVVSIIYLKAFRKLFAGQFGVSSGEVHHS